MISKFLWEDILKEAERRGIPPAKKRAILRQYLQVKLLTALYRLPSCQNLSFIGGTSLQLLRGLDRFSEDLDFDNFSLDPDKVKDLFKKASDSFRRENYNFEFDFKKTKNGGRGRISFEGLFFQMGVGSDPREKLMIRLDFTNQERIGTEVLLLSGFGMSERVVTNTLPVLLSQKIRALLTRKQTRGRDFYDIYWLLSRKVKPDLEVLETFNIRSEKEFFLKLKEVCSKEEKNISFYKKQIKPFLLHEENERYLDFLKDLIEAG